MPPQPLSRRSLLLLTELFERASQPTAGVDGQQLHGVPGWDIERMGVLPQDALDAWTDRIGYAGAFPAPLGDDQVPVDLQEDDDPGRFRYRCPETFRTKYAQAADVAIHAVRGMQLLHTIADLLGIPHALRSGIDCPAVPERLWLLGKVRIADFHVDAWYARGVTSDSGPMFAHLASPARPNRGIILTGGHGGPTPPREYALVPIADVLSPHAAAPIVDTDLLHRLLTPPLPNNDQQSPVRFDTYTNALVISTRPIAPWYIKGVRQAAAVHYLVKQFHAGRRWVPAREILAAAYGPTSTGRSQRMQNLFSGNTHWERYLSGDGKGNYGFLVE